MPRSRRDHRERTHDWQQIQQYTLWPEQKVYELLRPVVLFGETDAQRAKETGTSERTLHHKADQFDQQGMTSLFHKQTTPSPDKARSLPPDMRQLIVDLKAEHAGFRPHEIATICFLHFGRRPSDHTVQRVLADGPRPSITMRRYLPYAQIADPYQRRRAIVDLHAQGWSITTISAYLQTLDTGCMKCSNDGQKRDIQGLTTNRVRPIIQSVRSRCAIPTRSKNWRATLIWEPTG